MELCYSGSIRRISGSGMAFKSFKNHMGSDMVGKKTPCEVPDTFIEIHEINDEGIDFSFFFFDKETKIFIKKGEHHEYKNEGNAFGFVYNFTVE